MRFGPLLSCLVISLLVVADAGCSPATRTATATVADVANTLCDEATTPDECGRRILQLMNELDGESLIDHMCEEKADDDEKT